MTDKELLQQALNVMEDLGIKEAQITSEAIKARLAQPDCVCGEPDSEGIHRKDKPCYIEPEFEQINYEEWRFNPMTGESLYDVQSEPEPVAYVSGDEHFQGIDWNLSVPELPNGTPLYTAPPKKEWVGLTEEEKLISYSMYEQMGSIGFVQAIEAKLKEKNA